MPAVTGRLGLGSYSALEESKMTTEKCFSCPPPKGLSGLPSVGNSAFCPLFLGMCHEPWHLGSPMNMYCEISSTRFNPGFPKPVRTRTGLGPALKGGRHPTNTCPTPNALQNLGTPFHSTHKMVVSCGCCHSITHLVAQNNTKVFSYGAGSQESGRGLGRLKSRCG